MNRSFTAQLCTRIPRLLRVFVWATFTRAKCGVILSAAASEVGFGRGDFAAFRNARNGDR